ncbi:sugar ABC transporter ATP-binding protein [Lichenicola sp.]|uniref:sugar ABC transporter ATP-binding protein n=1 Tax=Lichenicola sp. TaxID=2804529 RepID=UPI003B00C5CF
MSSALLDVIGLTKSFDGVVALADGRFRLEPGTVHALCGGNGAGKSTFLSIVMGIQQRDGGTIEVDGRPVSFSHPSQALANGIAIIEQELSPVLDLTVAENIFLGREPMAAFGRVDFGAMRRDAEQLLQQLGFVIDPRSIMRSLSIGQIQLVEIAKALSHDARIIIMDEPTSALGETEVGQLYTAVKRLRDQGKGIIYVSHRLTEIFGLADEYTVFRDGRYVSSGRVADIDRAGLIGMIVGRALSDEYVKTNVPGETTRLAVEGLSLPGTLSDISFDVRAGEIVGFYGLLGAGRTELMECLFGMSRGWTGRMSVDGVPVRAASPRAAMDAGLALVTEDRKQSGLVLTSSVRENLSLAMLPSLSPRGVMDRKRESGLAAAAIQRFGIRTATDALAVASLSGGNQQKVVIGRFDMTTPKVFLFDEPTRGVDVGAKREIYAIMSEFASKGGAVVMVSGEAEEILGMCDRIVVMRQGRIAAILERADADQQTMLHLAA